MYILQYCSGSIYSTRIEVATGSSIDIGTGSYVSWSIDT
jgi:hypothetical protein